MPSRATVRLDQEGVDADGVVLLALPRPQTPAARAAGVWGERGRLWSGSWSASACGY